MNTGPLVRIYEMILGQLWPDGKNTSASSITQIGKRTLTVHIFVHTIKL